MKFAPILFLLTISLVSSRVDANILVNLYNGTQIEMEAYQIFYKGSAVEPLTEPLTSNVTFDVDSSDRKFLLVYRDTPIETIIVEAQQKGCIGVVYGSSIVVVGGYLQYRKEDFYMASQVNITVVEVGFVQFGAGLGSELLKALATEGLVESITILPDETENPWVPVYSSGWIYVWSILFMLFSAANIVMASLQLRKFFLFYGGCTQAIAIYVLFIEMTANLIRMVVALDFFGTLNFYPEWVIVCLRELHIPFMIASFFLFTLYWHELMTSVSIIVHPFIVKMRIPFFVISPFVLAVQIIKTIVRSYTQLTGFNFIISAFYTVCFSFIVVFYSVTGAKLLIRMRKSQSLGKTLKLSKTTIKVLCSCAFMAVATVLAALWATGIPMTPIGYILNWFACIALVSVSSLMNILAFELPSKYSSSSHGKSGAHPRTSSVVVEAAAEPSGVAQSSSS